MLERYEIVSCDVLPAEDEALRRRLERDRRAGSYDTVNGVLDTVDGRDELRRMIEHLVADGHSPPYLLRSGIPDLRAMAFRAIAQQGETDGNGNCDDYVQGFCRGLELASELAMAYIARTFGSLRCCKCGRIAPDGIGASSNAEVLAFVEGCPHTENVRDMFDALGPS